VKEGEKLQLWKELQEVQERINEKVWGDIFGEVSYKREIVLVLVEI